MDMAMRRGPGVARVLAFLAALVVLFVGAAPLAAAQSGDIRGKLAYQLGYGYTQEEITENALTLEVSFERRLGPDGKVHIDVDGRVAAAGEPSEWQLGEAYLDWYTDTTDWRIGRQVVSWGTADGINPTNVINPRGPLSPASLSLSSGELKGAPLLALLGSYYLPSGGSLTAVAVTEYVPAPDGQRLLEALAARVGAQLGGGPLPVAGPGPLPAGEQFEWAVRGETLVGGHNVYVSYFRGWDDYPAAWIEYVPTPDGPLPARIVAAHRRGQKIGLATAGTLGDAGVWTEVGYTIPDELSGLDAAGALSSNEGYIEAVVGADYTFANGLTLSAQIIHTGGGSLLSPYRAPGQDVDPQTYGLVIGRYAPAQGHQLEGAALANLGDGGIMVIGRYTYDITQATKLTLGATHVIASAEAEFVQIRNAANMLTAGIEVNF